MKRTRSISTSKTTHSIATSKTIFNSRTRSISTSKFSISTSKTTHSIATSKTTFNSHFLTLAMILRRTFFFLSSNKYVTNFKHMICFFLRSRVWHFFFCRATNTSRISNIWYVFFLRSRIWQFFFVEQQIHHAVKRSSSSLMSVAKRSRIYSE